MVAWECLGVTYGINSRSWEEREIEIGEVGGDGDQRVVEVESEEERAESKSGSRGKEEDSREERSEVRREVRELCGGVSGGRGRPKHYTTKLRVSQATCRPGMSRVPYASTVGSLMFVIICTRPDIAHAVGVVSWYMAEPGREHWEAVKRILRYIKGTSDVALCFGDSYLIVTGYVDSDYAGDLDGSKSTTGYVFTLFGGTVSWVSKLQSVVAMSTTEAEYVVAAQASKEAVWLKMLLEELGHKQEKITLFCDNQSALYLARNQAFIQRQIIYEFNITSLMRRWKKEPWICRRFIFMITWQIT
ncbi:hypothetical protein Tco_1334562 [Tanacetum coccineum]